MQIDTLRPTANVSTTGWARLENCASPIADASAAWEVLSDDDDDTFVTGSPVVPPLVLDCGTHTPPASHERHLIRVRGLFLGDSASGTQRMIALQEDEAVRSLITTIPAGFCVLLERAGGYNASGLIGAGAVDYGYELRSQSGFGDCQLAEAYIDIDCRAQPTFTAQVQGGPTITTTPTPTLRFGSANYDGLAQRTWRYAVYTLAQTLAGGFDPFVTTPVTEGSGTGVAADQTTIPIANDDYVAYMQISSTIRVDSQYDSDIETVAFEIDFDAPPAPDVSTTVNATPPSVEVCWSAPSPSGGDVAWDDPDDVVVEVQRSDCGGEFVTVYVEQTGVDDCWTDRFVPLSGEGAFCGEEEECAITYRVRYWGLVSTLLVATDWTTDAPLEVDNPTPANPWLRGPISGDLSICTDESWTRTRPFGAFQQVSGGSPTVVTGAPGGRDYTLTIAVDTLADLATLEAILAAALVFYQPIMQADTWLAPATESVTVTKVKRVHQVSASFVAVAAQPQPTPQSFF